MFNACLTDNGHPSRIKNMFGVGGVRAHALADWGALSTTPPQHDHVGGRVIVRGGVGGSTGPPPRKRGVTLFFFGGGEVTPPNHDPPGGGDGYGVFMGGLVMWKGV